MLLRITTASSLLAFAIGCGQRPAGVASKTPGAVFDSIVYHSSACFGSCPVYHLQINNDRQVKFHAADVYLRDSLFKEDTAKTGYFEGKLRDSVFNQLEATLTAIPIDSLVYDPRDNCCDGSLQTVIIYYQGKRKFVQYMFNPGKAEALTKMLYLICRENALPKTNKELKIESPYVNVPEVPESK